jgi:hypothetical protein
MNDRTLPPDSGHPYDDLVPDDMVYSGDTDPDFPDASPRPAAENGSYPASDYDCLDCPVEPDCNPRDPACLKRTPQQRAQDRQRTLELLLAIQALASAGCAINGTSIAARLNRTRSGIRPRLQRALAQGLIRRWGRRIALTEAGERMLQEGDAMDT